MTGARSQSRDLALQGLYQFDLRGEEARDSVEALLAAAEPGVRDYAKTLIDGVRARANSGPCAAQMRQELSRPYDRMWRITR